MDSTDAKLLQLLAQRARGAEADLAASLGLSPDELSGRLQRIEQRSADDDEAPRLTAFVTLRLSSPSERDALGPWLARTAEVLEAHHVTGASEVLLKLRCRDPQALDDLLSAGAPGLRVRTDVVLGTLKAAAASDQPASRPQPPPVPAQKAAPVPAAASRPQPPPPPPSTRVGAQAPPLPADAEQRLSRPQPPPPPQAKAAPAEGEPASLRPQARAERAPEARPQPAAPVEVEAKPMLTAAPTLAMQSIDIEGSLMGVEVDIDSLHERVDESVFSNPAPEPVTPSGRKRKWASAPRRGMPLTNNEKTILKALIAVLWADGRVEKSELELIEEVLAAFEASPAEREVLREFAREPRSLDTDVSFDGFSEEDRELLLTNAALMAQADGWQSPAERKLLNDLAARLGYNEEQARIIFNAAVEDGVLSLPSRVLEESH